MTNEKSFFNLGSLALLGAGVVGGYVLWKNRSKIQRLLESQGEVVQSGLARITDSVDRGVSSLTRSPAITEKDNSSLAV